jgi:2-methylcitrate dehydratase PrpD
MTVLGQLAEYVVHSKFSASDREAVSVHLLDTATALICGRFTPEGEQCINKFYHDENLTHFNFREDSVLDRVLINCSLARLSEIDDIHISSCVTPGCVIIPTAMSLFSCNPMQSTDSFMDAVIIGYELMTRLGKTIQGAEILYKGIWPTLFCAAFGTAAVTARMLQLSEEETAHALSLALTLSTGGVSRSEQSTFRWFTLGYAAKSGCTAAIVASKGYKGNLEMLDADWLKQTYGIETDPIYLTKELGETKMIDRISLKPFCSAKQVIPAIIGFQKILEQGIPISEIEAINIYVPLKFVRMINHKPANRLSSLTSVHYQLALAAYSPLGLFDVARSEILKTEEIETFMDKIFVFADPDLSQLYPDQWPARIEVISSRGLTTEFIQESPGDPGLRLSQSELQEKVHHFLDPITGAARAQEIIQWSSDAASNQASLLQLVHCLHDTVQSQNLI